MPTLCCCHSVVHGEKIQSSRPLHQVQIQLLQLADTSKAFWGLKQLWLKLQEDVEMFVCAAKIYTSLALILVKNICDITVPLSGRYFLSTKHLLTVSTESAEHFFISVSFSN